MDTNRPRPSGHLLVPAAAIGSLSILLAAGLSLLGMLDRLDGMAASLVTREKAADFPQSLPEWSLWLAALGFAFGLSFSILSVPGTWRRLILWLTSLALIAAWAPVLSLAAYAPDIATPFIAALWSGVCALVYAGKHRMPCEEITDPRPPQKTP